MKLLEIGSSEQLLENAPKFPMRGRIFGFPSFDLANPVPVFALYCLNTRRNRNGQCKSLHRKEKNCSKNFERAIARSHTAQCHTHIHTMPHRAKIPHAPESRATMEAKSRMASYSKFFLRKSKTPKNHPKASIAYSSTQEWILSGGFLGFSIVRKEKVAIKINYRGGPAFWGVRYLLAT